jgi:hypothetical protein
MSAWRDVVGSLEVVEEWYEEDGEEEYFSISTRPSNFETMTKAEKIIIEN